MFRAISRAYSLFTASVERVDLTPSREASRDRTLRGKRRVRARKAAA